MVPGSMVICGWHGSDLCVCQSQHTAAKPVAYVQQEEKGEGYYFDISIG